jgi:hypothetical protein
MAGEGWRARASVRGAGSALEAEGRHWPDEMSMVCFGGVVGGPGDGRGWTVSGGRGSAAVPRSRNTPGAILHPSAWLSGPFHSILLVVYCVLSPPTRPAQQITTTTTTGALHQHQRRQRQQLRRWILLLLAAPWNGGLLI